MELSKYVGKVVRIDLTNGFYYQGKVLSADTNSLEIRDKKGCLVTLSINSIAFIREVHNGH